MRRDQELEWVQRNRERPDSAHRIGARMRALAGDALQDEHLAEVLALGQAIAAVVDEEFRSHCRYSVSRRGWLVVAVDNPTLLPMIQRRWAQPLRDVLAQTGRRLRVRDVVFERGSAGMMVPAAPGPGA